MELTINTRLSLVDSSKAQTRFIIEKTFTLNKFFKDEEEDPVSSYYMSKTQNKKFFRMKS
jgi:hypothetical protein